MLHEPNITSYAELFYKWIITTKGLFDKSYLFEIKPTETDLFDLFEIALQIGRLVRVVLYLFQIDLFGKTCLVNIQMRAYNKGICGLFKNINLI